MANTNGFYVAITNNSMHPQIKYEGIEISPGTETLIGITRSFMSKLPNPYGDCGSYSNSRFFQIASNITQYSRNLCYEICFQYKYAIPNCGCADPSIDSNENNVTPCTVQSGGQCLYISRNIFQGEFLYFKLKKIMCE